MNLKIKNVLIRTCYVIPLVLFIYTILEDLFFLDKQFRQIEPIIVISGVIFFYQSLRNSLIGWILVMILYLAFLYFVVIGIFTSISDLGGKIDDKTFLFQCGFAISYLSLGYLYWKLRPKKRII